MKDNSTDYYFDVQTDDGNKRKPCEQSRVRLTVDRLDIFYVKEIKGYIKVINRPSQVAYERIEYSFEILIGCIIFTTR